jgi:hypothetical protein
MLGDERNDRSQGMVSIGRYLASVAVVSASSCIRLAVRARKPRQLTKSAHKRIAKGARDVAVCRAEWTVSERDARYFCSTRFAQNKRKARASTNRPPPVQGARLCLGCLVRHRAARQDLRDASPLTSSGWRLSSLPSFQPCCTCRLPRDDPPDQLAG